jgi:hypothetical protein
VDKSRALDMLMKHTGGYEKDNTQKQSKIIIIDIIDDDEELPNEGDPDSALPNNETGINEDEFIDE